MSKKQKNVPKLRFPGFDEAWEQRRLGEVAQITMGQSPDGSTYSDTPSDYILVQGNADLKDGWVSPRIWTTQRTKTADAGDLIMSVRAPAGAMGKTAYDVVLGRGVAGIKGNEFLFQILVKMDGDGYWKKLAAGSTFESLNSDAVNNAVIAIPQDIDEQRSIGDFLQNFDTLISLQQRKLDQIKEYKKGMLQMMFPKEGETVPEMRFPGFTGEWEWRKLGEVSDVRDGTHDSPSYMREGHPFVTSKNVKDGYINYEDIQFISDEDFEAINKRSKVDVNDILMGMIGTIGNLALIRTEPDFAIKNVALIKDTGQISYLYLYHYLQSPSTEKQLFSGLDGGTQKFISLKNIRELNIAMPSEIEQFKIGAFFESLATFISLHQRKLDAMREYKKGLLQQMFV